ncbi:hypothetical protein Sjap_011547 [Stephania japonica]|uniref:Uncharacterized protein n=1 Tax=Stephania japonica TaxID=461633 RepID=A0AAP0JCL2_9MAGN
MYWEAVYDLLLFDIEEDVAGLIQCPNNKNSAEIVPILAAFLPGTGVGEPRGRGGDGMNGEAKRGRYDCCSSFAEITLEEPVSSLKDLDSEKMKSEIKRWARAVVAYARQVSGHIS